LKNNRNKELRGLRRISSNKSEEGEDTIEIEESLELDENVGKKLIDKEKVETGNVIIIF
jgi:hypothetical protein